MHAHEICAHEMTPIKVHAHETHAGEMHAYEIHAHEVYPRGVHARGMYAIRHMPMLGSARKTASLGTLKGMENLYFYAHPNLAALHPHSRPHDGPPCDRVLGLKLALGGQNMLSHSRSPGERFPLCLPPTYKNPLSPQDLEVPVPNLVSSLPSVTFVKLLHRKGPAPFLAPPAPSPTSCLLLIVIGRRNDTADELLARVEANGY